MSVNTRSFIHGLCAAGLVALCGCVLERGTPVEPPVDSHEMPVLAEESVVSADQINDIGKAVHNQAIRDGKRPLPTVEGWQLFVPVPFYSQKDQNWASIPLGFGSETIRQSGCLLVALCMHYAKWGIVQMNPPGLNTWCRNNGGFLWPTNLIKHDIAIDYGGNRSSRVISVNQIYPELAAGHPVVIRIKTPSISSHYLVIYGFDGSRFWVKESLNDWPSQDVPLYGSLYSAWDAVRVYGY